MTLVNVPFFHFLMISQKEVYVYLFLVASQRGISEYKDETELNTCVRVCCLFSTWVTLEILSYLVILKKKFWIRSGLKLIRDTSVVQESLSPVSLATSTLAFQVIRRN